MYQTQEMCFFAYADALDQLFAKGLINEKGYKAALIDFAEYTDDFLVDVLQKAKPNMSKDDLIKLANTFTNTNTVNNALTQAKKIALSIR